MKNAARKTARLSRPILVGLLLVLSTTGCSLTSLFDTSTTTVVVKPPETPLPSGPITAEMVNPINAHRAADALWDEMDREQQKGTATAKR